MPAIVIRDHGERGVANFGFARELRLREIGHADDVETKLAIRVRFGERGKLRALHANVRSAAMNFHADARAGISKLSGQISAGRFVEANMSDDAIAEKCGGAKTRAVEELVGNQEIKRRQIVA